MCIRDSGYRQEFEILHNISFDVRPGQTVALVGPSGAGKSTVIKLLHRFFDASQGSIRLDEHDIRSLDRKSFLNQIALVPQETLLFGGTVKENILYGKLDATDQELEDAAKKANAHDFIVDLENGYETIVGEKGAKLSGGERQRIAIARAILKDPKILVLDEATSSLDAETENKIQKAIAYLTKDRTTIVIAHRLSTILNSDNIYVIDQGKVVGEGNHKELLTKSEIYKNFYEKQIRKD